MPNFVDVDSFSSQHYIRLLRTFALKFNWAFQDGYPYLWIIQQGFLFSLFLLHKKARNFIEDISLSPYFVRAFPGIFKEFGPKKREVEAIKEYYSEDELIGKQIAVVVNLEHREIRGIRSQGMLLAADDGRNPVSLLVTDRKVDDNAKVR